MCRLGTNARLQYRVAIRELRHDPDHDRMRDICAGLREPPPAGVNWYCEDCEHGSAMLRQVPGVRLTQRGRQVIWDDWVDPYAFPVPDF